jgi:hypothetical protein
METSPGAPPPASRGPYGGLIVILRWTRYSVLVCGGLIFLIVVAGFNFVDVVHLGGPQAPSLAGQPVQARPSDQIALDIMSVKPGGPATNFAAYLPTTTLSAPAQSVVSFTIRNFDLDAALLPDGSQVYQVQGTVGGVAYADGKAYTSLDRTRIAHTFSVPALHLNVPIPGASASGKRYVTVTFRVRTGSAGVYAWRCMAPCGEGQDGQSGPMADENYMRGTLFVQG